MTLSIRIVSHKVFAKSKCDRAASFIAVTNLQRNVINRLFLLKITFTGKFYYTLAPINVKTSRYEFYAYKECAKYEGKIKPASWLTVNCKVPDVRYIIIQRKEGSRTYWTMQICEVVVIGHILACKYY